MSSAGSYLLNMIHERTNHKLQGVLWSAKDYEPVLKAWFETAEEMVKEFEAEGLHKTAEALKEEIKWQREHCY